MCCKVPDHQCAKSPAIALEAACARMALVSVEENSTDDSWDVLMMTKTAYMNGLKSDIEISCAMLGIQRCSEVGLFVLISLLRAIESFGTSK